MIPESALLAQTLASISFCAEHFKGGDRINQLPSQEHWEWLEEAVHLYQEMGFTMIVSCTGFAGMTNINNSPTDRSRDVAWRIFRKTRGILGVPENPGHQVGAALCIRQGLECADQLRYPFLLHTAEDVVPDRAALRIMLQSLQNGHDYAGEVWGENRDELNSQFFACRVQALVGPWDACQVPGDGHIERYLYRLLQGKKLCLQATNYRSTHDHSEWVRLVHERKPC